MAFTLDQAELIGASLQSVAFGLYLLCFAASLYVLLAHAKLQQRRANRTLLFGSVLLFCFITAHWCLDQLRLWAGFIRHENMPDGPLIFYGDLSDWRNVARNFIFVLEIITIDSLLLYRLYMIWGGDWRVIVLPTLTLCGTIVSGIAYCIGFVHAPAGADLWHLEAAKWVIAAFTLTLVTNMLAVALITGRILLRDRALKSTGVSPLSSIVAITIESAGIYCVINLIIVVTLVARTPFNYTIRDIASPVTGISFCLITLRVGLSKSLRMHSPPALSSIIGGRHNSGSLGFPMQIHITREHASMSEPVSFASVQSSMLRAHGQRVSKSATTGDIQDASRGYGVAKSSTAGTDSVHGASLGAKGVGHAESALSWTEGACSV